MKVLAQFFVSFIIAVAILYPIYNFFMYGFGEYEKHDKKEFKFFDGNKIVSCFEYNWSHCGYELKQCTNGVEYLCLGDIRRIK